MINIKELKEFLKWLDNNEYIKIDDIDVWWTDCCLSEIEYETTKHEYYFRTENYDILPKQMLIGYMEQYIFEKHSTFIGQQFSNNKEWNKKSFIDKRYEQLINEIKSLDNKKEGKNNE